jgi:hypothetical protein
LKWVNELVRVGIVGDRIYCEVPPLQIGFHAVTVLLSKVNGCLVEYNSSNLPLGIQDYKSSFVVFSKLSRCLYSLSRQNKVQVQVLSTSSQQSIPYSTAY